MIDPRGRIVDCIGFPTVTYEPLVRGSDELFELRWYFCGDAAEQLPFPCKIATLERLWDSDLFLFSNRGGGGCEQRGLYRSVCPPPRWSGTDKPLGDADWYANGVPPELVGPPLTIGDSCCDNLGHDGAFSRFDL